MLVLWIKYEHIKTVNYDDTCIAIHDRIYYTNSWHNFVLDYLLLYYYDTACWLNINVDVGHSQPCMIAK